MRETTRSEKGKRIEARDIFHCVRLNNRPILLKESDTQIREKYKTERISLVRRLINQLRYLHGRHV